MPSHLATEPNKKRPSFVTTFHVEGNDRADKMAAEAANSNQVDREVANRHIKLHKLTKAIQLRLATISLYLPKHMYDKDSTNMEPIGRAPKPTITELMVLSPHNLFIDHCNFIVCSTCNSKCHNNDCQANRDFILSLCHNPFKYNANHFTPVNVPASLGHLKTHSSHILHCYRGIFFCSVCGSFAQQKLKKLAAPCTKILSSHGKRVLDALANHKPPVPLTGWPECLPPAALMQRAAAPLEPEAFLESPPDESGWTLEEAEAFESFQGQVFDFQADNFAKYQK